MHSSAFDGPLAGGKVVGSSVSNGVALVNVECFSDEEKSPGEPTFGTLGSGGRPLPPDADGFAETISARSADGLPVIATRDLRIEKARASDPAEGTVYLAGYHGAELHFEVPSAGVSTASLRDSSGKALLIDSQGVRVPAANLIQGDPAQAKDLLLAQPAIAYNSISGQILTILVAAVNGLAPGTITPTQITDLGTALGPYLAAGSPPAPTTRAPGVRGAPGA